MASALTEITDYWLKYYATTHCTLCGNTGVIDTRATARTPNGLNVGRLNWCICPNGQALRKACKGAQPTEDR